MPLTPSSEGKEFSCPDENNTSVVRTATGKPYSYKGTEIKWMNAICIVAFHMLGVFAFFYTVAKATHLCILWAFFLGGVGGFGLTGGVHRMWTHRSYKAKLPLRIILMVCFAVAGQNSIYDWVRDHRVHHKYSETDADPHNVKRGFFFAHVGWLMMHKHPDVISKGAAIDMSDILADPVARFHEKYFLPMKVVFCFLIPVFVPIVCWGESWQVAILGPGVCRYMLNLNFTWFVNSAAHIWGSKPYDRRIAPTENRSVALVAMGEGWHNYHHVFPWDYKAAELGNYQLNVTAMWIDIFAKLGWAYDLKSATPSLIQKTAEQFGDGTHYRCGHLHEVPPPKDE